MSIDRAKEFIKFLHNNEVVRTEVHLAAEAIVLVAKANGYDVTREEISDALKKHWITNTDPTDPGVAPLESAPDLLPQCALKLSEAPGF